MSRATGSRGRRPVPPAALAAWIAGGLLVLSRLLPPGGLPGPDLCLLHAVTGRPCPGCGLTRAFVALAHGQVRVAWHLHPFALPLYALCLGALAWPWVLRAIPAAAGAGRSRALRGAALVFVAAWLIFGAWRALHVPGPVPMPGA